MKIDLIKRNGKAEIQDFMLVRAFIWIVVGSTLCFEAIGKNFSTRVFDSLGRPVESVRVDLYWIRSVPHGEAERVDLGNALTDFRGRAKGYFQEKLLPRGENLWVEISKPGYSGYSTTGLDRRFVIKREFRPENLDEIATLSPVDRVRELRELLAGDFEGNELQKQIFVHESEFRSALHDLITDRKVGKQAIWPLAFVGTPEDIRWIVEHAPRAGRELFDDRWAYAVACSLTKPTTDREWAFLRKCANGDFKDGWVDAGGVQTLKLIASDKSIKILEEARGKNKDRAAYIDGALAYARSNPTPLSDSDLKQLAERVALIVKIGKWRENRPPVYNANGDKAYVDLIFVAGRDRLVYTATFHKEGDLWKLRGVRETMQALMAREE